VRKALQYFTDEYLSISSKMSPEEICAFLEQYQEIITGKDRKSKLISIRVPENLLEVFKKKAESVGVAYQSQIMRLMREWIRKSH
jgi:predicted DNA binding CopG/RHH family protein